jgi:hypothetical protein
LVVACAAASYALPTTFMVLTHLVKTMSTAWGVSRRLSSSCVSRTSFMNRVLSIIAPYIHVFVQWITRVRMFFPLRVSLSFLSILSPLIFSPINFLSY